MKGSHVALPSDSQYTVHMGSEPDSVGQTPAQLEESCPAARAVQGGCSRTQRVWGAATTLGSAGAHLAHAPHDTELLRVDEALQHHPDGHVDVIFHHIVPQVHAGMSLSHPDHGLNVTHCDGDAAGCLRGAEEATPY